MCNYFGRYIFICIFVPTKTNKMKTTLRLLITLAAFLLATLIGSQANAQELSIYLPKYTKHYKSDRLYDVNANGSEGGSRGFLLTYTKGVNHFTFGHMENSYGTFSRYYMLGRTIKTKGKGELSIHLGVGDKYYGAYTTNVQKTRMKKYLPKLMNDNYLMPISTLTYRRTLIGGLGFQANVSPIFVNVGLMFKL